MRRWALALLLTACAPQASTMSERIGGAARTRAFASASAYEMFLRAELLAHGAGGETDPEAAERALEYAALADPSDGYIPARRAELLLSRGHTREAINLLDDTLHAHPDASAVWMVLAEARRASGDLRGAHEAAARALANDPDDPDVRALVATIAGATRETADTARATAPDARAGDRVLDPNSPFRRRTRAMRRQRAAECARRAQWREVERILGPMVASGDAETSDRVRLIEARAADGRWRDAARLVPGVPIEGEGAVPRVERARLWLLAGHPEQARVEAEEAITQEGEDPRVSLILGQSLGALDRWDEALSALARVPPSAAEFAESRVWAARGLNLRGMRAVALALLEHARQQAIGAGASEEARARIEAERRALAGVTENDRDSLPHP